MISRVNCKEGERRKEKQVTRAGGTWALNLKKQPSSRTPGARCPLLFALHRSTGNRGLFQVRGSLPCKYQRKYCFRVLACSIRFSLIRKGVETKYFNSSCNYDRILQFLLIILHPLIDIRKQLFSIRHSF